MIYRTATGVQWDQKRKTLHSPVPNDWSYSQWLDHIIDVVRINGRVDLQINNQTKWINIQDDLKKEILRIK